MNVQGWLRRRVHRDTANLSDVGEGENVRDRLAVVPDLAQVWEITDHWGILVAAVGERAKDVSALPDVG